VPRPRLIEQLNAGLHRRLTLVSAPPGYGKTTLVTGWLNSAERPFTWLSLDENDNDPARFFTYLVAALQKIDPDIGQAAQAMLQAPPPPPPEALLTSLYIAPDRQKHQPTSEAFGPLTETRLTESPGITQPAVESNGTDESTPGRSLDPPGDETETSAQARMRAKLATPAGKATYSQRKETNGRCGV
jgi:hypothetical protein